MACIYKKRNILRRRWNKGGHVKCLSKCVLCEEKGLLERLSTASSRCISSELPWEFVLLQILFISLNESRIKQKKSHILIPPYSSYPGCLLASAFIHVLHVNDRNRLYYYIKHPKKTVFTMPNCAITFTINQSYDLAWSAEKSQRMDPSHLYYRN